MGFRLPVVLSLSLGVTSQGRSNLQVNIATRCFDPPSPELGIYRFIFNIYNNFVTFLTNITRLFHEPPMGLRTCLRGNLSGHKVVEQAMADA